MLSRLLKSIWIESQVEALKIYKINIKEIGCSELRAAYLLMSVLRQKKCDSLINDDDKKRCIAADMLLRKALSEITGDAPEFFEFAQTETGKPYSTNSLYRFSVSHSGDYVAVAVDASREVGIDIEMIRPVKAGVMRFFCSPEEADFITGESEIPNDILSDPDVLERFYRVWTYKEAFVKLTGEGITDAVKGIKYDKGRCCTEIFEGYCLTAVTE